MELLSTRKKREKEMLKEVKRTSYIRLQLRYKFAHLGEIASFANPKPYVAVWPRLKVNLLYSNLGRFFANIKPITDFFYNAYYVMLWEDLV